MKKHLTLVAGAGMLLLGVPAVTMAQAGAATSGPFADVPADHWAYQAVDTLQKAGIVIGYPDGTYGGKRAMTRTSPPSRAASTPSRPASLPSRKSNAESSSPAPSTSSPRATT
jgi:hypothetical protein